MYLLLVRWAERERAPSKSAALGLEADDDYEIPGACISKVVSVGAGSSPIRSHLQQRQQRPFGYRQVMVEKRQKWLSKWCRMASLLLYIY